MKSIVHTVLKLKGFFGVRSRVLTTEYETAHVSSSIDFQRPGPIMLPLLLSRPITDLFKKRPGVTLVGRNFGHRPTSVSSPPPPPLPPRLADCFCHQSHRGKKEIESAVSTVSRVSLRTQLQDGRFPLLAVPVKRFTGITT